MSAERNMVSCDGAIIRSLGMIPRFYFGNYVKLPKQVEVGL